MSHEMINLKVSVPSLGVNKVLQFSISTLVKDAIDIIVEKIPNLNESHKSEFGLFMPPIDEEKKGSWLSLNHDFYFYSMKHGDNVMFKNRMRRLKVKMLDGTTKIIMADDSQPVQEIIDLMTSKIGITNSSEYSLSLEENQEISRNDPRNSTLTKNAITKKLEERERKKMEKIKQKLHTDDELHWLHHNRSLFENGVDENQTVVLRRKYFYEQNENIKDPVELNLLYNQCRDGILSGTTICTFDEACTFAAHQMQIDYGDFNEEKYKASDFDVKNYLPKDQHKNTKAAEKKIMAQHNELVGVSSQNGKYRYCNICQNLTTYGVSIFLVKEKMEGKQKLVPILLGITKDRVMRMDEKSKEVLYTWPLTAVKRWAASPNSFTLDFGDYSENLYSVMTSESERIAQLISGYIEIILRKLREKELEGLGYSIAAVTADDMSSGLGMIFKGNKTGQLVQGGIINSHLKQFSQNFLGGSYSEPLFQGTLISGNAKRNLQDMIAMMNSDVFNEAAFIQELMRSTDFLNKAVAEKLKLGKDDLDKAQIHDLGAYSSDLLAAASAATTALLNMLNDNDPKNPRYIIALRELNTVIPQLIESLGKLSTLEGEKQGDDLINDVNNLLRCLGSYFDAFNPNQEDYNLDAAKFAKAIPALCSAFMQLSNRLNNPFTSNQIKENIVKSGKLIASVVSGIIEQAKTAAKHMDGEEKLRANIIAAAKAAASSTSSLISATRILSSSMNNANAKREVALFMNEVSKNITDLVKLCETTGKLDTKQLMDSFNDFLRAMEDLKANVSTIPEDPSVMEIFNAYQYLINAITEQVNYAPGSQASLKNAKDVVSRAFNLIRVLNEKYKEDPTNEKYLALMKLLTPEIAKLVAAIRDGDGLTVASGVENFSKSLNKIFYSILHKPIFAELKGNATDVITSMHGLALLSSENFDTLLRNSELLSNSIKAAEKEGPNNNDELLSLISRAMDVLKSNTLVVGEEIARLQNSTDPINAALKAQKIDMLNLNSGRLNESILKMLKLANVESTPQLLEIADKINKNVNEINEQFSKGTLKALNEHSKWNASKAKDYVISSFAKELDAIRQLSEAVSNENYQQLHENGLMVLMKKKDFNLAVRGYLTAPDSDKVASKNIIKQLLNNHGPAVEFIKKMDEFMKQKSDIAKNEAVKSLKEYQKSVCESLFCMPGTEMIKNALVEFENSLTKLNSVLSQSLPKGDKSEYDNVLNGFTESVNTLNNMLMTTLMNQLSGKKNMEEDYEQLNSQVSKVGGAGANFSAYLDPLSRPMYLEALQNCLNTVASIIVQIKLMSQTESGLDQNALIEAVRNVSNQLSTLISPVLSYNPGAKGASYLYIILKELLPLKFEFPNFPQTISEDYIDSVDKVNEQLEIVRRIMSEIITNEQKFARLSKMDERFLEFSKAVDIITNEAMQASYFQAISQPENTTGKFRYVNCNKMKKQKDLLILALKELSENDCNSYKIDDCKNTFDATVSEITECIEQCVATGEKVPTNVGKAINVALQDFYDVSNVISKFLGNYVKDGNAERRLHIEKGIEKFTESMDNLIKAASHPALSSTPGRLNEAGLNSQKQIINAAKKVLEESTSFAGKSRDILSRNPTKVTKEKQPINVYAENMINSMVNLSSIMCATFPSNAIVQREIKNLRKCHDDLVDAEVKSIANNMNPPKNQKIDEKKLLEVLYKLVDGVQNLEDVKFKNSPLNVQNETVINMTENMRKLGEEIIEFGANLKIDSNDQNQINERTEMFSTASRTVKDLIHLFNAVCSNPKKKVYDEASKQFIPAVKDFKVSVNNLEKKVNMISAKYVGVDSFIEIINKSMEEANKSILNPNKNGVQLSAIQSSLESHLTNFISIAQNMVKASTTNPSQLKVLSNELSVTYKKIVSECITLNEEGVGILKLIKELAGQSTNLIKSADQVIENPKDLDKKKDMAHKSKDCMTHANKILSTLKAASTYEDIFNKAALDLNRQIGEIEASILFAETGALEPTDNTSFAVLGQELIKITMEVGKHLENIQNVVSSKGDINEPIDMLFKSLETHCKALNDAAAALMSSNSVAQIELLQTGRKFYDGILHDYSKLKDIKNPTKVLETKKSSEILIDYVKAKVSGMQEGIEIIKKLINDVKIRSSLLEEGKSKGKVSTNDIVKPEDLVSLSKGITVASSAALQASNTKQHSDIKKAANMSVENITTFLNAAETFYASEKPKDLFKSHDNDFRKSITFVCSSFSSMLNGLLDSCTNEKDVKGTQMHDLSKNVTNKVVAFVKTMTQIKGSAMENDPITEAEQELLSAAEKIEAAAKKLAELIPKRTVKSEVNKDLNFEEQIVEAAKSITKAASILVASATHAQRELVSSGVFQYSSNNSEAGQWSQGLISAAQLVAGSTADLCEAANDAVKGNASKEKLIAAANSISASTIQLIMACKVKADPHSEGQMKLNTAGNAVRKATKALIDAVEKTGVFTDENDEEIVVDNQFVGGRKQELEMMEAILKKERELTEAREKLMKLRKMKK